MRKTDLTQEALCLAISEMENGLIDAELGGGIVKKRVALPGRGKRGGARTLVATNKGSLWFFVFGFEKVKRCRRFAMPTKSKETSRILDAVHETARDLHEASFISKRRMREYDALCLDPVPMYSSETIRALRKRYNISQAVLASILNTSISTVRQWEIGEKHPSGPSLKLLNLLDRKGLEAVI